MNNPPKIHLKTGGAASPPGAAPAAPESEIPGAIRRSEYRARRGPRLPTLRRRGGGEPGPPLAPSPERTAPKPRRRGHRIRRIVVIVSLLLVALLVGGLVWGWVLWSGIPTGEALPQPTIDGPEGILIIGSDSRSALAGDQFGGTTVQGQRADTIMLAVRSNGGGFTMMSIPRDLRVEIPGAGTGKINGAYNGGPAQLAGAVSNATGLPVDHYVEVNFDGFRELSIAVGGVEVCTDTPIRDAFSNLDLPAGCQVISGDTALAWVRSRHAEVFVNGRWQADPRGDFGRIDRQQQFMKKLFSALSGPGALFKLSSVGSAAQGAFRLDKGFSYWHALRLGFGLAPSPGGEMKFGTLPSCPQRIAGIDFVVKKEPQAQQVLDSLKAGDSPVFPENVCG